MSFLQEKCFRIAWGNKARVQFLEFSEGQGFHSCAAFTKDGNVVVDDVLDFHSDCMWPGRLILSSSLKTPCYGITVKGNISG